MQTKVIKQDFKGSLIFSIWEVDSEEKPVRQFPLVSLGKKKLSILLKHLDEVKEFVGNKNEC